MNAKREEERERGRVERRGAGKTNKSSRNSFALDSDSIKSKEAEASEL